MLMWLEKKLFGVEEKAVAFCSAGGNSDTTFEHGGRGSKVGYPPPPPCLPLTLYRNSGKGTTERIVSFATNLLVQLGIL